MMLETEIKQIIAKAVASLNRPDLFREPLISFSAADDARYDALKTRIGGWHLSPTELLPEAKSVVSYFVPFTRPVVKEPRTVKDGSFLWSEAYQEINRHFIAVNDSVSAYLEGLGYKTKTIKPTHTYDPKDLRCFWSHRSAAVIAGLGDFGANRLVITEKGSGGRFCTVLTSTYLQAPTKPVENKCLYKKNGSCGLCFRVCPVGALKPDTMDKFACQEELNRNEKKMKGMSALQSADTCGKCISVCPVAYIE